ncbi:MAG: PIN domain-containing protein [Gemmatimonadetes bacterium]|nr:PIN domain-containing protein [Gemmatimonadota bacterium]MCY3943850.1 PIN domain-containing protein [Gemmatimonadota bacterium]
MLVFDTNVLLYAADEGSEHHEPCRSRIEDARRSASPAFLTWNICYEFLRASTHRWVYRSPWTPDAARGFLTALVESPGITMLLPTRRHAAVLEQTIGELPDVRGNQMYDLHTAVLMREHGVGRICTRDTGFHRFPFLTVVDPLR